jgi:hypothetical protein
MTYICIIARSVSMSRLFQDIFKKIQLKTVPKNALARCMTFSVVKNYLAFVTLKKITIKIKKIGRQIIFKILQFY